MSPLRSRWEQLALALVALNLLAIAFYIYFEQKLFSIDGAFQTYHGIVSFARGEAIGTEFQSYLGVVMPLSLLPAFWLLGGTVFASSVAAAIACYAGLLVTLHVLLTLVGLRDARARLLASIVLISALAIVYFRMMEPGWSLRPYRWAMPFLLALAVLPLFRRLVVLLRTGGRVAPVVVSLGVLGGLALVWSNDTGLPTVLSLGGALLFLLVRRATAMRTVAVLAGFVAVATATVAVLMAALTHGRPGAWLRYNFGAIPADQFWLFSSWQEQYRFFDISDLRHLFASSMAGSAVILSIVGCALFCLVALLRRRGPPARLATLLFVLGASLGSALLPQVAGHIGVGYARGALLPGVIAPAVLLGWRWVRIQRFATRGARLLPLLRIATILCATASLVVLSARAWKVSPARKGFVYSSLIGAYVPPQEASAVDIFRQLGADYDRAGVPPRQRLLSTYYSALNVAAGAPTPTPYPAIIHALGDEGRARYAAVLEKRAVPVVATINPGYSDWENWNQRSSWYFYRALFANYHPVARTVQHILWRPRAAPAAAPVPLACTLRPAGPSSLEIVVRGDDPRLAAAPRWLAQIDVRAPADVARPGRWYWMAQDLDTPNTHRPVPFLYFWEDYPRYGLAPGESPSLMADLAPGRPSRLALHIIPAARAGQLAGTTCRARAMVPAPDFAAVPPLVSAAQLR